MAAFLVGVYLAAVALNPAALGISIAPASRASEEAIGVLTFLLKALLRAVPVAFGAGVVCGALLLAYACGQVFSGDKGIESGRRTPPGWPTTASWWFAGLPLVAYLAFLLCCLVLDLWRSVLSLQPATTIRGKQ